MTTISTIASHQGGSGKTTTAMNLGVRLTEKGRRVLLLDGDPQGSLTATAAPGRSGVPGLLDIVRGRVEPVMAVGPTERERLALLTSGVRNADDAAILERFVSSGELPELLRNTATGFDHLVIDAPAGTGPLARAYLAASHGVVATVACSGPGLDTLPIFLELFSSVRKTANPRLKLRGFLLFVRPGDKEGLRLARRFKESLAESSPYRAWLQRFRPPLLESPARDGEAVIARLAGMLDGKDASLETQRRIEVEGNYREERLENILWRLCAQTGLRAALLVDGRGLPLAIYNLEMGRSGYAAVTAVLAETLETTGNVLRHSRPSHLTVDLREDERLHLYRFAAYGSPYHLVAVGPPCVTPEEVLQDYARALIREM